MRFTAQKTPPCLDNVTYVRPVRDQGFRGSWPLGLAPRPCARTGRQPVPVRERIDAAVRLAGQCSEPGLVHVGDPEGRHGLRDDPLPGDDKVRQHRRRRVLDRDHVYRPGRVLVKNISSHSGNDSTCGQNLKSVGRGRPDDESCTELDGRA